VLEDAPATGGAGLGGGLERLKNLMGFRLVMVTTLLLAAVYVEAVSDDLLPVNPLYFLIGLTYALTVVHALVLTLLPYRVQVYTQVISDLLIITGLVYLTGGVRTGFILLYLISVLSGSVLLFEGRGFTLAGLATLFYAGVLLAVRTERVPAQGLSDVLFLSPERLVYSIFVTGVACATVAMIGSYLSQSLQSVGEQLEEASEQVADLQELNKVIVASIHSGLITSDAAGRVLYINDFGASILGRRSSELRGEPLQAVFGERFEAPALRVRAASEKLSRLQLSYARPDGTLLDLGISVSRLASAEFGKGGFLLAFQDLTIIKQLEEEVRLKEKLAAVGEVAARLAHEIRNPLGSISGSAQVLSGEPNISEEQQRLLAIITRESRRLSDTLNHVLYQVRTPSSSPEPVDIGPVLQEAVTLLRNAPEVGPDHSVELALDEGPHVCLADRDQIVQVFWNLARNGLEAMPDGGVLRVELRSSEEEVVLVMRDEGRGIRREELRRMFEPFRSTTSMGLGLGLAIVYRIIKEHRGDIDVRSVAEQGTEVEVRLPLVPVETPA